MTTQDTRKPKMQNKYTRYITHALDPVEVAREVAILIRNDIPHKRKHKNINTTIKHITLKLHDTTYITRIYNQPKIHISSSNLNSLLSISNKVLLHGDFNVNHSLKFPIHQLKRQNNFPIYQYPKCPDPLPFLPHAFPAQLHDSLQPYTLPFIKTSI